MLPFVLPPFRPLAPRRRLAWVVPARYAGPVFLALTCLLPERTVAEGFRNPPPDSFSLGRAGGRIAQIDDAAAATQNPANLTDLKRAQFSVNPNFVYIHVDADTPAGSAHTVQPWKVLPSFFAVLPLKEQYCAVGLGVTVPYGLSNEWDPNGPFRYSAPHFAELKTINVNPSFALRVADQLSLGVGVDAMWSQLNLQQFLTPLLPGSEATVKGDGLGWGGNAALTWQVTPRQRLALTYRSPILVDYGGHSRLRNVPTALAPAASPFASQIKFPTIVAAGYGVQLTDRIRLETDVEWLQFSNFKNLPAVGANLQAIGFPASFPEHWKNTFTAGLGGDWSFAPGWVLRSSYQFYDSPVPDATFTPVIPDANQHVFTVGLGYHHKHYWLEGAYGGIFYDDRHIANGPAYAYNGTYRIIVHLVALSYRYSF